MKFRLIAVAAATVALAACGSSDDASTEAEADTVEITADEAMEPVVEEPVVDETATVVEETTAPAAAVSSNEAAAVEEAGDNAAETAEAAMDAMAEN